MIVVVVGTGTEIGKTTFTTAWLRRLRRLGLPAIGWKPIETGGDGDEAALGRACGRRLPALYRFERPVSPHLEARRAATPIDLAAIQTRTRELESMGGALIVETAGGLYSPLDDRGATNAELATAIAGKIVLVARNRLGVLHDVEACRRALAASARIWNALILTGGAPPDASQSTNAEELRRRLSPPVLSGNFMASDAELEPLDGWFA